MYARIKVMLLASKYKKQIGKCEDCGSITKGLEAPHVTGSERPTKVWTLASFLSKNWSNNL